MEAVSRVDKQLQMLGEFDLAAQYREVEATKFLCNFVARTSGE
jgi:hypothetical protein